MTSCRLSTGRILCCAAALAWLGSASGARAEGASNLAAHVVVVYNADSPSSAGLAHYYAKARSLPEERLLGIHCPADEEISRAQYREIEKAIRAYLMAKKWLGESTLPAGAGISVATHNDVWCLVLIQGIPLKIANDPTLHEPAPKLAALNTNAASVDSELSLLPTVGLPLAGVVANPYYSFMGSHPFDELDARQMILVGRLDGPSEAVVRRMIDDALYAEGHRLAGRAYVDAQGLTDKNSGYYKGDEWMFAGAQKLEEAGWPVGVDRDAKVYPENLPWRDVAIYGGWYTEKAMGPFMRDEAPPVFARGAIAYHLHSYSAATLRSATEHWCGPLLARGAAATMGCVYEPYLDLTPHWDIFIDRLLSGTSFIEAAYASEKVLSWMTTFVGDPLYTPFKVPLDQALADPTTPPVTHDFLRLQWIRLRLKEGRFLEAKASLGALTADPKLTAIGWEGAGDLCATTSLGTPEEALADYAKGAEEAATVEDEIRIRFKEIALDQKLNRGAEAQRLIARVLSRHPDEASYFDIGKLATEVAQATPAPATEAASQPAPAPTPAPTAPAPAPRAPTPSILKPAVSSTSAAKPSALPPSMP
jgi:uncharacterized protein (TIGR03790 family)